LVVVRKSSLYIQGDLEEKVNILGDYSIGRCEKNVVYIYRVV